MDEQSKESKPRASFLASMKAVAWSFFGVRKKSAYEHDSANLNPVHVIIAALIGVAIFIAVLITVVKSVVGSQ
ncbi:MAG TPA: DUF2970 domain-containing protein [Burkholderiaceae bacterium]